MTLAGQLGFGKRGIRSPALTSHCCPRQGSLPNVSKYKLCSRKKIVRAAGDFATLAQIPLNGKQVGLRPDSLEVYGAIDTSLIEHSLKLSYEERIEANDSAIELVRELQTAGQEYYARQSKSPT